MATSVGTIAVNVTADTSKLSRNLAKARTGLQRFSSSVRKTLRPMLRFGSIIGGVGVVGGVAGFAAGIRKAADDIDLLAKTSAKLGITVDNLTALQHAGELTGVASRTMAMGWQRATRRIAEAAKGTGEAQAALKELGLAARRLMEMSSWDRLKTISDRMKLVKNEADRVRLSMKLFDSEGVALVNTMMLGSTGLQNVKRDIIAMGLSLEGKGVKSVESFNDAMTKLKATVGGVFKGFVIDISPRLTELVEGLQEALVGAKVIAKELRTTKPRDMSYAQLAVVAWQGWRKYNPVASVNTGFGPTAQKIGAQFAPRGSAAKRFPQLTRPRGGMRQRLGAAYKSFAEYNPFFRGNDQATGSVAKRPPGVMGLRIPPKLDPYRPKEPHRGKTGSFFGALFGSSKEIESGGKKWRQKNSGAIENVAREFLHKLQKTVREGKFRVGVGLKSIAENREQGGAFQNQLPLLRQMFGLDKVVENAQQQAASSGSRPANQALQANTMAGFTALRANMRGGEQREMKDILRKQLEAMVGSNGTNTLLLRVIDAIAKEQDIELGVEIP